MSKYESIIRDGKTFIDIKAAEDLRMEINKILEKRASDSVKRETYLARIAELEEQLSVWRSVFPALASRLFPENGDE